VSITTKEHNHDKGEELYNLAMESIKKSEEAKKFNEEKLLREQYDAMNKQRERTQQREKAAAQKRESNPKLEKLNTVKDSKDRAAGVAVVKTIVKQSQPKVKVDQHTTDDNKHDEAYWQHIAREQLKEAAFRYGHRLALTKLGNVALEYNKQSEHLSFIDKEKFLAWMDESPIDLKHLLKLSDYAEGKSSSSEDGMYNIYDRFLTPYQQIAAVLYKAAGRRGSAEAWYNFGHLLWESIDDESRKSASLKDEAFEAFYKSAQQGDADAIYFLAAQFLSHDEGDTSAASREFTSFLRSSRDKMNVAIFQIRRCDLENIEPLAFEDDLHDTGYSLLARAALEFNHGPALQHLATIHHEAKGDNNEFKALLSAAADTGHAESLFLQG
jgi:hypothetical protein